MRDNLKNTITILIILIFTILIPGIVGVVRMGYWECENWEYGIMDNRQ